MEELHEVEVVEDTVVVAEVDIAEIVEVVEDTVVVVRVVVGTTVLLVVKVLQKVDTHQEEKEDHHMLHVVMTLVEMVVDMLHDHALQMVEDHNLVATIVLLVATVHPIVMRQTRYRIYKKTPNESWEIFH